MNQTNGTVSWKTIAMMIMGGVKRVQPVSAKSIAKYVMRHLEPSTHQQNYSQQSMNATNSNVTSGQSYSKFSGRGQILLHHRHNCFLSILTRNGSIALLFDPITSGFPFLKLLQIITINTRRILQRRSCTLHVLATSQKIMNRGTGVRAC